MDRGIEVSAEEARALLKVVDRAIAELEAAQDRTEADDEELSELKMTRTQLNFHIETQKEPDNG